MSVPEEVLVDEAARETYPASDAPSWTPTHAGTPLHPRHRTGNPTDVQRRLRANVEAITLAIEREQQRRASDAGEARRSTANFIANAFLEAGRTVTRIPLGVETTVETVEAILHGTPSADNDGQIVVGVSYDGLVPSPAPAAAGVANAISDNSSIVTLLALARHLEGTSFIRTVRLVAFANAPHDLPLSGLSRDRRGSRVYARRLRDRHVHVHGMIGLDSLALSNPDGAMVAIYGNTASRDLAKELRQGFRRGSPLPLRTFVLPSLLPLVSSADQRSFWREGMAAARLSAFPPSYFGQPARPISPAHTPAPKADFDVITTFVLGLAQAVSDLAGGEAQRLKA
ncbi:MAG: hypothetical protein FWD73_02725 [Polyangiaceae bacterium]|nr:hypothetical protein [Polyangiaceae bacterium]